MEYNTPCNIMQDSSLWTPELFFGPPIASLNLKEKAHFHGIKLI